MINFIINVEYFMIKNNIYIIISIYIYIYNYFNHLIIEEFKNQAI